MTNKRMDLLRDRVEKQRKLIKSKGNTISSLYSNGNWALGVMDGLDTAIRILEGLDD